MDNHNELSIKSIKIEELNGKYNFVFFPIPHGDDKFILCTDRSGENEIVLDSNMSIDKGKLEKLSDAYAFLKNGKKYGTPVRIINKCPSIRQILLLPEGKVKLILTDMDTYTASAELDIKFLKEKISKGEIRLEKGVTEFDFAQAGIIFNEEIKIEMQICFHIKDDNQTHIFGPKTYMPLVINPPVPERIICNEKDIRLKLKDEASLPLYVRMYKDGQRIFGDMSAELNAEREYVVPTDTLNMRDGFYAISIICMNEMVSSYSSDVFPIITVYPCIRSISRNGRKYIIRMEECARYGWKEETAGNKQKEVYEWTDEIRTDGEKVPEIRYADEYSGVISLGPMAHMNRISESGFEIKDGYFYRSDRKSDCHLTGQYVEYKNNSFTITEESGIWKLSIAQERKNEFNQNFKDLLSEECSAYEQIEELSSCFGDMMLKPEDMLFVRYGYEPQMGACDIRAGMILCFDHTEYQNIPEADRRMDREDVLSDRNLSGFVGNGSSMYHSILRNGKVTFEPFAHDTVECGIMDVHAPVIGQDGRISMGSGIWNTLFGEFETAFIKLLYPSVWERSMYSNRGSMFYYDNICLVAADSYKDLEKAAECYRNQEKPVESAAYVCFRGNTTIKLMIHIFLDGIPQICPLGTRLGDIIATYGLSGDVILKRLYGSQYINFIITDINIPLYIGDKICTS